MIVNPFQNMIKKDGSFKWHNEEKESFYEIKEAITEAPTLRSPYYTKGFIWYTFTSDSSYTAILTQKI